LGSIILREENIVMSRGSRCPLNQSGFKLILASKNVDDANVFINRMVNEALGGAVTSKKGIRQYSNLITVSGMGLRKGWDGTLEDLSQKSWVSGATLPEDVQERLHPTPAEEEKKEENPRSNMTTKLLSGAKLAELQRRLHKGDLDVSSSTTKPVAVEPTPAPKKPVATVPVEPTPREAAPVKEEIEILDVPVECIVTKNMKTFQTKCDELGLNLSDATFELLVGKKFSVTKFKPSQACVIVNGTEMWIPDTRGILIKKRPRKIQQKPGTPPMKQLKFQIEKTAARLSEEKTPAKRTPEEVSTDRTKDLEKQIKTLQNEVSLLEKQKDLYRTDLEKERIRRRTLEQTTVQAEEKAGFSMMTEREFSNFVKTYPRGPKKMLLIPTTGSCGLAEVHLYLWLENPETPTLTLRQCGVDLQMAKDLACTIAFQKLCDVSPYRNHFRQTSI